MFPEGGPGLALFLLRICVATVFLMNTEHPTGLPPVLFAGVLLVCISLSIGFLTPVLSVVACLTLAVNLFIGPHSNNLILVPPILSAAALALLGPGAYSLDARLFGRRVVVVPPRKYSDR